MERLASVIAFLILIFLGLCNVAIDAQYYYRQTFYHHDRPHGYDDAANNVVPDTYYYHFDDSHGNDRHALAAVRSDSDDDEDDEGKMKTMMAMDDDGPYEMIMFENEDDDENRTFGTSKNFKWNLVHRYAGNLTAKIDLFDRLFGVDGLPTQIVIGATLLTGRTIALLTFGALYNYFLERSVGRTRTFLESLDFYFNQEDFEINVGRNFRNYFLLVTGRFSVALLVYGPQRTFEVLRTFDYIDFALMNDNTFTFIIGMTLEVFGEVGIWTFLAFLGNSGLIATSNPPPVRYGDDRIGRDPIVMLSRDNPEAQIANNFKRILKSLEDTSEMAFMGL